MLFLLVSFIAIATKLAFSAVIGIDLGSEFMKIALISPGKSFEIVENIASKRKTNNVLGFVDEQRVYENDAMNKRSKFPENTFVFMNKYLGIGKNHFGGSDYEDCLQRGKLNYELYIHSLDEHRDSFMFELKNFHFRDSNETVRLSAEEIVAMILKYASKLSNKQAKMTVKDCVITVPSDWTVNQRRALLDAAEMAGLNVMALVNENSAAAVYMAIDRKNSNQSSNIIFYNIGSFSAKITLANLKGVNKSIGGKNQVVQSINILADEVSNDISGLQMDLALVNHFVEVIDKKPLYNGKSSIREDSKAMIRLIKETNRIKETLSASKEVTFYVEGLLKDGSDFSIHITRNDVDKIFNPIYEKLFAPIESVLKLANLTLEEVEVVEILGGAVRVPGIQNKLKEFLGNKELGAHLNGDEAMALGAAFIAANLSHAFKVRPIYLKDGFSYGVHLDIKSLSEGSNFTRSITLFPQKTRFGTRKIVSFTLDENIEAQLSYNCSNPNMNGVKIASYNVTNVTALMELEKFAPLGKPKISLEFLITSSEGVILEKAEAIFEEIRIVEVEEMKAEVPKNKSEDSTEKPSNETNPENSTSNETSTPTIEASSNSSETNSSTETAAPEKKLKKKTFVHRRDLNVSFQIFGLKKTNSQDFEAAKKMLEKLDAHEEDLRKLSEAKNKLEAFIYQVNEFLEEENFKGHSKDSEQEELKKLSTENEEFLWSDEASSANRSEFVRRYYKMEDLVTRIQDRIKESQKRPEAVLALKDKITEIEKKHAELETSMPWLNETQKAPLTKLLEETKTWLDEKSAEQALKKGWEEASYTVSVLTFKKKRIHEMYYEIKAIRKPKPPKVTFPNSE